MSGPVSCGDVGPLFSSLLVHQQASPTLSDLPTQRKHIAWFNQIEDAITDHPYGRNALPLEPVEKRFRHGHWIERREKVAAALLASGAGQQRIERFAKCGSECIVEVSVDGQHARLKANYCGDRFCEPCCQARAAKMFHQVMSAIGRERVKFLTLTRRDDGRSLIESLDHLRKSWTNLRGMKFFEDNVQAGAYAIEITRGSTGSGWHVHIHALIVANWVAYDEWVAGWSKATGGSTGVYIKPAREKERDVAYVCKYATKGIDPAICDDHEATVECIIALRARRLIGFLGDWHNLTYPGIIGPKIHYVSMGRLGAVAAACRAHQTWAVQVVEMLGRQFDWVGDVPQVNPSGDG